MNSKVKWHDGVPASQIYSTYRQSPNKILLDEKISLDAASCYIRPTQILKQHFVILTTTCGFGKQN